DRPVALRRVDGHALWANTRAMELAGVTRDTPEPAGGRILRDDAGEPTGVFVDNAMGLIESTIAGPSAEVIERRILAAAQVAVAAGLTGVHEMGIGDQTIEVYRALEARGALPLRVYAFLQGDPVVAASLDQRAPPETEASASELFTLRAMKLYADGALGSRGAAMLSPYSDAPGETGNWVHTPEELNAAIEAAVAHGWQLGVHAIGDAGNRAVLDAYQTALAPRSGQDLRLRIEHVQVLAPEDLPRLAALGVIASMQPTHATSDMPWAEARVGGERIAGAYAWRSILASGARLAAGSDFPVEEVSPMLGLHAAVTRQDAGGEPPGGWHPGQRLTLEEAIAGFTTGAAYASFTETERGMVRRGYLADLTVWDRPLAPDTLLATRAALTIVGGRVVFERR
ncbi:MAG TPA: amidohydrolase, partial [Kofleriaceae bacterium]|nr:amidohydrolase [Kofleriaceae bacterium]